MNAIGQKKTSSSLEIWGQKAELGSSALDRTPAQPLVKLISLYSKTLNIQVRKIEIDYELMLICAILFVKCSKTAQRKKG
jgi:hypothetical protein